MACQANQPGSIVNTSRETLSAGKVIQRAIGRVQQLGRSDPDRHELVPTRPVEAERAVYGDERFIVKWLPDPGTGITQYDDTGGKAYPNAKGANGFGDAAKPVCCSRR